MLPRYAKYALRRLWCVVDAERDLERVQRLRVDAAPVAGHHRERRVARHEARDEEVQRDRGPERDHEEPEPAEDESHAPRLMSGNCASGRHPFGFRWRSMTAQSGTSYAAGFANALFFVTQPASDLVLYWYQSTPSVIGMIGTSSHHRRLELVDDRCCSPALVVAA